MNQQKVLCGANDPIPASLLILSSVQHLLLALSLGLTLPFAVAKSAGISVEESGLFLSMALLSIGVTSILQTISTRYIGSGLQAFSQSDSAAIAASTTAASVGGMPLFYTMTLFSGILKVAFSSFIYRLRKFFPPEVTGCMIFILSINITPTVLRYFLGSDIFSQTASLSPYHIPIAFIALFVMIFCTMFLKKNKAYSALIGMFIGSILAWFAGLFDMQKIAQLSQTPLFGIPIPKIEFAFDWRLVIPFFVVTIATIVDNIGDYSAMQKINDSNFKRPDWKSIQNGIRAAGIGSIFSGIIGGVPQATATANIGVASATGVTSRKIAYLTGIFFIVLAFFPRVTGILMLMPECIIGAALLYSNAYIMAGGFEGIASVEMDDRRIFVVFISITVAISTLIPGLWVAAPQSFVDVFVSPMVMGSTVLLIMTLVAKIGRKQSITHSCAIDNKAIPELNDKILEACREWAAPKEICSKLKIAADALLEGLITLGLTSDVHMNISYDQMEIKLRMECTDAKVAGLDIDGSSPVMDLSIKMVKNMFDNIHMTCKENVLKIEMKTDV